MAGRALGAGWALEEIAEETGAEVIGIDWQTQAGDARRRLDPFGVTLQGNFEPTWLFSTPEVVRQRTLEMLLDDTDMQFSRYSYMYIWMPKLQEWVYVCHQFNYSRTSVKLAQDVWNVVSAPDGYDNATGERIVGYDEWQHGKNKQKCHVIVTHTHVAQDGFSPDGNWRTIGMGCMRDDKRTKYKRARATKFPEWNQGFVVLRNGYFSALTKHGTDWADLLGPELYGLLQGDEA